MSILKYVFMTPYQEREGENEVVVGETAAACGFVPPDYFRRYSVADIFGHGEVCEVDLGCGDGGFLLQIAQLHPDRLYIGVERLLNRLRKVCKRGNRLALTNMRGLWVESRYFLEWMIQPGSVRRIHYLFPDPWPKLKHQKKRFIQGDTAEILHRALTQDGELLFRTDHHDYFMWVCEHLTVAGLFRREAWDDLSSYPTTDFQRQWEAMGRPVFSARFISCRPVS